MNYTVLTMTAIIFIIASVITAVSAILPLQEAMSLQINTITINSDTNSHQDATISTKTHDNNNANQQNDDNICKNQRGSCSHSTTKKVIDGIKLEIPFP
jgi:hypothetical protein